jgi:hypothetical protein
MMRQRAQASFRRLMVTRVRQGQVCDARFGRTNVSLPAAGGHGGLKIRSGDAIEAFALPPPGIPDRQPPKEERDAAIV